MSDERLGQIAGAWLRETLPPPRDPRGSVARAMANTAETPQQRPSRLLAFLARDPDGLTDAPRLTAASHAETGVAPHEAPPAPGGATKMALATLASFATAVVVVGTFLLQGGLADTTPVTNPATSPSAVAVGTSEPPASPTPSWRRAEDSPFGSLGAVGAWTGEDVIVVDIPTGRTATYDPAADSWTSRPQGPSTLDEGLSVWTGSELLLFDIDSAAARAYDTDADTWRALPDGLLAWPDAAVWTGDNAVLVGRVRHWDEIHATAMLDPVTGTWTRLPNLPASVWPTALFWTGEEVLALVEPPEGSAITVMQLDLEEQSWSDPSSGPIDRLAGEPIWTGEELVFAAGRSNTPELTLNGTYDPESRTWATRDYDCPVASGSAVWDGELIIDPIARWHHEPDAAYALEPSSGRCQRLPDSRVRTDYLDRHEPELTILAGNEIMLWSRYGGSRDPKPDRQAILLDLDVALMPGQPDDEPGPRYRPVDWGPLTVVDSPGGGPDAGFGPVTLHIGDRCVTAGRGRGETTLVWSSGAVDWRPGNRRIVFTDTKGSTTRFDDGDTAMFGGMPLERDGDEEGNRAGAWLDGLWLNEPDPSCPESYWLVGDAILEEAR